MYLNIHLDNERKNKSFRENYRKWERDRKWKRLKSNEICLCMNIMYYNIKCRILEKYGDREKVSNSGFNLIEAQYIQAKPPCTPNIHIKKLMARG
jgi:hypothetical protein